MKLSEHADHTEALLGLRAEAIHRWLDDFFDAEGFGDFQRNGAAGDFDPYAHRKYRHSAEALEAACREFAGSYTRTQIREVVECHIRDDYDGFIPLQEDFESGAFARKYHEETARDAPETILSGEELQSYFRSPSYPRRRTQPGKLSAGFYWRMVWPTAIAALLFALSAPTILLPLFHEGMMKQKRTMIRELTATAASAIESFVHQEQRGEISREVAQQRAAAEIAQMRYGVDAKDYFWITDMHPRMVMHPYRAELIGRDLTDYTDLEDKSGKRLFAEFVRLVERDGEGYLEYLWQWMDDATRAEPKLSYVRGIPEWGWIIGTGIYIHDVEAEIRRLSRNLLIADGAIAAILIGMLGYLLLQSRRLEIDRKRAENGLREAKDRYRALVEGGKVGYLLEIEGQTIYSNPTLQDLTGYDESQLLETPPWELLDPNREQNQAADRHLRETYAHRGRSGECEARILTRKGGALDVQISTSRIFLAESNGHVISFAEIHRDATDTLQALRQRDPAPAPPTDLPRQIREAQTPGEIIEILKRLPEQVRTRIEQGVKPALLRELIGEAYDALVQRVIEQVQADVPPPGTPFAFLSLGSTARHEMTLFSDQDNALIFADVPAARLVATRQGFLALAHQLCGRLNQAGYPYCPGGIMASNPAWCLSLSEWKEKFRQWITQASPESILEVNVFLDIRCAHGDAALVNALQSHIRDLIRQHPPFFLHYATNCLTYKAPLGLLGRLRTEKHGAERTLNIRDGIKAIETFARIYALRHDAAGPGTVQRLQSLCEAGHLQEESGREIIFVFDYLWQLRFFNQITAHTELSSEPDELDTARLTELERETLQSALSRIPRIQAKLSYDFLGVAPR